MSDENPKKKHYVASPARGTSHARPIYFFRIISLLCIDYISSMEASSVRNLTPYMYVDI